MTGPDRTAEMDRNLTRIEIERHDRERLERIRQLRIAATGLNVTIPGTLRYLLDFWEETVSEESIDDNR